MTLSEINTRILKNRALSFLTEKNIFRLGIRLPSVLEHRFIRKCRGHTHLFIIGYYTV